MTIQDVTSLATEVLENDGSHALTLLLEGTRRQYAVALPDIPGASDARHSQMHAVGRSIGKNEALGDLVQGFCISEAWVSQAPSGQIPTRRPSQDPQRREVLFIAQFTVAHGVLSVTIFDVLRSADSPRVRLRPFNANQYDPAAVQSPLLDAFLSGYNDARAQRRDR